MPNQKYKLLSSEEDGEVPSPHGGFSYLAWARGFSSKQLIVNLAIFTAGLVVGFSLDHIHPRNDSDYAQYSMVPSPAFEAISSHPLTLTHHENEGHGPSPYKGFPTPERTARWMELMDGYSVRVPSTSLEPLNLKSIPLNDGSGDVWASMNVFHHLHCLDSIRHEIAGVGCSDGGARSNHTEYAEGGEAWFPPHIDHCIETLRQRLICQPDLGIRAIRWNPEKPGVAGANNTVDSACVNWDAVKEWAKRHSFTEEEKLITRPDGGIYRGPRTPPARCGE